MNQVLKWIKGNVFIVIFVVVMIAAVVTLPFIIAPKMNAGVKKEVESRAAKSRELANLEKAELQVPGDPDAGRNGVVNEAFLEDYEAAVAKRSVDAELVRTIALEHNSKGRQVLMPELFPEPDKAQAEVLPKAFWGRLVAAYEQMLADASAGGPPPVDQVVDELRKRQAQFRDDLAKRAGDPLTEEEQKALAEKLTERRLAVYARRAEEIALYVTASDLDVPEWDQSNQPRLPELFEWHWRYWMTQDILNALKKANASSPSVIQAPLKRVLWLQPDSGVEVAAPAGGGGFGQPRGSKPAEGRPANPKSEASLDFAVSVTGRVTNPLYDVRYIKLILIVDSRRLPEVLDAIAAENFISIVDMVAEPVDPFIHVADGYFYGSSTLANVELTLETVWLRQWTKEFMPEALKVALGIPVEQQPGG